MNEDDLDRDCVERCLQGDRDAFEPLLVRYERPVYNAVLRMVGDAEEARDIAQEIFVKVFENLPSFDPSRKFFSWMYRVAINETINHIKARRRWEPLSDTFESSRSNPEQAMQEVERDREIQRALLALDPKYRLAVIVRHFLQLSYAEAAHVLDVPEKTVKSRLFTARQQLKEILEGKVNVI
ncbi:MAG: RNA polymerase sigma factor [Thermoanaerobaculia bacterium]